MKKLDWILLDLLERRAAALALNPSDERRSSSAFLSCQHIIRMRFYLICSWPEGRTLSPAARLQIAADGRNACRRGGKPSSHVFLTSAGREAHSACR